MVDANVIAAFLSFMAACAAAYATWKGPINAARIAESLRIKAEKQTEGRRLKSMVFYSLMQERSTLYSIEGVRALNLIDVAFIDNKEVRDCWIDLHASFNPENRVPQHTQEERIRNLLRAISKDLGLSDLLRSDDLSRHYYPTALAQDNLIRSMEREATISRLHGQPASADATSSHGATFPPRPS